jgi:putative FmdB family regulatory protein
MPTYRYKCPACSLEVDIVKTVAAIDNTECCENCHGDLLPNHRLLGACIFFGEKPEEPFYSIPLGKMVSGKSEMRRIAKERGMIEVGNENVDKINRCADNEREAKAKETWSEFEKPIEING